MAKISRAGVDPSGARSSYQPTEEDRCDTCCLAGNESQMQSATPEEGEAMTNEYAEFGKTMAERGVLQGGERLRSVSDATTVRVRNGEVLATDGPFAETKEQLGGYYVVECKDLDEASSPAPSR
jgi:hypothetical protein